ncbi:MAG: SHOCT domain-containing protein [Actinomycetes bacterium]
MMGWYNGGMGGAGPFMWIFMGLFWVALIVVIVFLVIKLLPGSGASATGVSRAADPQESPDEMLDRMFAAGEIDEPTYRARRTALNDMRRSS